MKNIHTDSGVIGLRYDQDIQLIEMNTDGSFTLMRPHQVLELIETLQRLVQLHDQLGMGDITRNCLRFCNSEGVLEEGAHSTLLSPPGASLYKMNRLALEHGHRYNFTHYKIVYERTALSTIYPTGVTKA